MATMQDVAERAGVSKTTVSHVINGTRHVSEETCARVLAAMAELDYQPNLLARSLRRKQTRTLGLLVPNSANPFFAEVGRGLEDASFARHYSVILCNADDNPDKELQYLGILVDKQVDGIVLVSSGAGRAAQDLLTERQVPAVLVDRVQETLTLDSVVTDNLDGGYQAARYLIGLGHRRIGCITGPSVLTPSADRVTGYRRALREAGIESDERLVVAGDFQSESGYHATRQLLALPDPPTAIFACNDMMAIGALCAVYESGHRVPDDVSIVGFDDIALASYTAPRLTTVAQSRYEIGRLAGQILLRRIEDRDAPPCHEQLPVSLVVRDSCRRLET